MTITGNPYVGPRSFTAKETDRYFGREREARELKALVISQRLTLFYAQSGAGKSSLLNTRLIPGLKEEGFFVLPVGRVGGALPPGMDGVANIFAYNLMDSLDMSQKAGPAMLAGLDLTRFLSGMTSDDDGETWYFDADALAEVEADASGEGDPDDDPADGEYVSVPTVLIIDQFEEIVTNNPDRWPDRTTFFEQLDAAMRADPQLWVVLTMREDFVATLDPYAGLLEDRLRARFYMERMGEEAALQAVQQPAEQAGKPFAPGVAQRLVDNLRLVRAQGQEDVYVPGQYVEPVQLQVVCFQLWESLRDDEKEAIELDDLKRLAEGGDLAKFVDKALGDFYERTLSEVLALDEVSVSEPELRTWIERQLITEAGTQGLVYQGEELTAGLSNNVVLALSGRYLLRGETRAGGTWYELIHDRFVDPILANNAAWFPTHQSALQRQAALWRDQGRPAGLLLQGDALAEAEAWAVEHEDELESHEQDFLAVCREAQVVAEREARQNRRIRNLLFAAITIGLMAFAAAGYAGFQTLKARDAQTLAEGRLAQFGDAVSGLGAKRLMTLIEDLQEAGDIKGAETLFQAAVKNNVELGAELWALELTPTARSLLLRLGLYVKIPAGEFVMGSGPEDALADSDEVPSHTVYLDEYWIMQTEVTNAQYQRCVDEGVCEAPDNDDWDIPDNAQRPVTHVSWSDADTYAKWVGGRLPTEAEWEKACRSTHGRIYPWGDAPPSEALLNSNSNVESTTDVGSYPPGANSLYDMSGNVWEWTADWYDSDYYANSPERNPQGPESGDFRTLRGGAWASDVNSVRCAYRDLLLPLGRLNGVGFRVGQLAGSLPDVRHETVR